MLSLRDGDGRFERDLPRSEQRDTEDRSAGSGRAEFGQEQSVARPPGSDAFGWRLIHCAVPTSCAAGT